MKSCVSGLENRDQQLKGSVALTARQPCIRCRSVGIDHLRTKKSRAVLPNCMTLRLAPDVAICPRLYSHHFVRIVLFGNQLQAVLLMYSYIESLLK
jgi:hypothetical protein